MQLTDFLSNGQPSLRRRRVASRLYRQFSNPGDKILRFTQRLVSHCDTRGPELNIPDKLLIVGKCGLLKDSLPENTGIIGRFGDALLRGNLLVYADNTILDARQAPGCGAKQLVIGHSHGHAPFSNRTLSRRLSSRLLNA